DLQPIPSMPPVLARAQLARSVFPISPPFFPAPPIQSPPSSPPPPSRAPPSSRVPPSPAKPIAESPESQPSSDHAGSPLLFVLSIFAVECPSPLRIKNAQHQLH